jgi:hypothetical protein
MSRSRTSTLLCLLVIVAVMLGVMPLGVYAGGPVKPTSGKSQATAPEKNKMEVTQAQREAAAEKNIKSGLDSGSTGLGLTPTPGGTPDYFGPYGNYANSPLPTVVPSAKPVFYFAEGTCRPNFDPYITVLNMGATTANVQITYMKGDGTRTIQNMEVGSNARGTAHPSDVLGVGDDAAHDFSAKVQCTNNQPIVAERPMYFNYKGVWTGGSDAIGCTAPSSTFYFAEGTCRPNFDPYITVLNTGTKSASITVTYMLGNGKTKTQDVSVAASARGTVHPPDVLGVGNDAAHDFSAKVQCTNGQKIVAERPMYFNFNGVWTGGHVVMGTTAPALDYYFAEGTCRPNFTPYLTIQNPNARDARVTITYMKGDGTTATANLTVPKTTRATVTPETTLGVGDDPAHDFSAKVSSTNDQPIIVERPMYFNYKGVWTGGHVVMGATSTGNAYYLAEGTCRTNFNPYLCIQNPGREDAVVTITYMRGNGTTAVDKVVVSAHSRSTILPQDKLGTGNSAEFDFSTKIECTNGQKTSTTRVHGPAGTTRWDSLSAPGSPLSPAPASGSS